VAGILDTLLGRNAEPKGDTLLGSLGDIPEFNDPNNPLYGQRHGGSIITGLLDSLRSGFTLPRDVYDGKVDLQSDEGQQRLMDMTGLAMTGGVGGAPAGALGSGPIRAYHGSPHKFDRFDLSKIGTGEGEQMYGHGLYFAENENVAKMYRDNLTQSKVPFFDRYEVEGRPLGAALDGISPRVKAYIDQGFEHARTDARQGALARIDEYLTKNPDGKLSDDFRSAREIVAASEQPKRGSVYEVEIKADPHKFLDWDNGGRDVYEGLVRERGSQAEATKELLSKEIPGIKYLDQGSRAAGDGSRNYVVFDDSLVDIVRKYGIAGLALLPPAVLLKNGIDPASVQKPDDKS
jgi:hypothetical protein